MTEPEQERVRKAMADIAAETRGRDDAIAQAVKQCIEFGYYGVEPPPSGHWLNEMWDFGRNLATDASTRPRWGAVLQARQEAACAF